MLLLLVCGCAVTTARKGSAGAHERNLTGRGDHHLMRTRDACDAPVALPAARGERVSVAERFLAQGVEGTPTGASTKRWPREVEFPAAAAAAAAENSVFCVAAESLTASWLSALAVPVANETSDGLIDGAAGRVAVWSLHGRVGRAASDARDSPVDRFF